MSLFIILPKSNNQSGAIAVSTALMLTMLVGFVALSIDTGYLVVTKNELRNAADAGALAGAINLYSKDGKVIQTGIIYAPDTTTVIATQGCNEIAYNTAIKNYSDNNPVEVNWANGNTGDVERGHWSFGKGTPTNPPTLTRGFYPNPSPTATVLWGVSEIDLDHDLSFINAVRVTTRREALPIASFFAKIFGYDSFQQRATAVAYIGFAGTFGEGEFEIPMALCEEYLGDQPYTCGVAVMFEQNENALWTNMQQPDPNTDGTFSDTCADSANANALIDLVETGNTQDLYLGGYIGVTNGIVDTALQALIDKWEENSIVEEDPKKRKIWEVTLPVVDCIDQAGDESNTCTKLVGGVRVELLWMTKKGDNPLAYEKVPYEYYNAEDELIFSSTATDGEQRWKEFCIDPDIDLKDSSGNYIEKLALKRLYFRASCDYAEPSGGPGGPNYGTLSERPALVD